MFKMRKYAKAIKVLVPTFFLVSLLAFFIVSATQAAALQAVYISLSRLKSGLNGSTGQEVEIILAIDPATTHTLYFLARSHKKTNRWAI